MKKLGVFLLVFFWTFGFAFASNAEVFADGQSLHQTVADGSTYSADPVRDVRANRPEVPLESMSFLFEKNGAEWVWDEWFGVPGMYHEDEPEVITSVYAITQHDGDLIAGGKFTSAGGVDAQNIARWDGSEWHPLGSGMDNFVYALLSHGGMLYAAGSFTQAGGIPASRIAKWDGTSWTALGVGFTGAIYSLAVHNNQLYAGGGGVPGAPWGGVSRWDGVNWHQLGPLSNGNILSLISHLGQLYAGGSFTEIGGISANCVARWDGSVWHSVGTGFIGHVHSLAVLGNTLFAGGDFTHAGGVIARGIAMWMGQNWGPVGTGLGTGYVWVSSMVALNGELFAGGAFSMTNGNWESIARWDGSQWHPLGPGVNQPIHALGIVKGDLIAGGTFYTAGGFESNSIARWYMLPLDLPFNESFDAIYAGPGWHLDPVWSISGTSNAGGVPNELWAKWVDFDGKSRAITPPIDVSNTASVNLAFQHYFWDYGFSYTGAARVQYSFDKTNWTDIWSHDFGGGNVPPVNFQADINMANKSGNTLYVSWLIDGHHYGFNHWYIDNINIEQVPVPLPFSEYFSEENALGWHLDPFWIISDSSLAGGEPYELKAKTVDFIGQSWAITPPLNISGIDIITIEFLHFYDDYHLFSGSANVVFSYDKTEWSYIWQHNFGTGNIGPQQFQEVIDLTWDESSGDTLYIAWFINGDHWGFDGWYIDNIVIKGPSEPLIPAPWLECFEDYSNSLYYWSQEKIVGDAEWTFAEGAGAGSVLTAYEGERNARFVSQSPGGANSPITRLITPMIDISGLENPALRFFYAQERWSPDQNELKVYARSGAKDQWVEIAHYTENTPVWTESEHFILNYQGTVQIAFEGINNWGRANVIDNVEIFDYQLPNEYSVTFQVFDSDTQLPVESAHIIITDEYKHHWEGWTGADGIWFLENEVPNGYYDYFVSYEGDYHTSQGAFTVAGQDVFITVYLEPVTPEPYSVTFLVYDQDTQWPIEGAEVIVTYAYKTDKAWDAVTDEYGLANILLYEGHYAYTVTAEGYYFSFGNFYVEYDELWVYVPMEPEYVPEQYTVTFTVFDYDTLEPVEGAGIDVYGAQYQYYGYTDEYGVYAVELYDGPYAYNVSAEGYENIEGHQFYVDGMDLDIMVYLYPHFIENVPAVISLEHQSIPGIWKWTYNPNKSVYLDTGPAMPGEINADKSQWTWQRLIQDLKAQKMMAGDISGNGVLEVIIHFNDNVLGYYSFTTGTWAVIMNDVFDFTVARTAPETPKKVVFSIAQGVYVLNYGTALTRLYTVPADILHSADLYRDGRDELLIGFSALPNLYVYSFATASHSVIAGIKPSQMVTGDITGDGYNELVCAFQGFGIYLFRNTAVKGQFSHKVSDDAVIFNIINDVPENHKWISGNKGWQIQRITYADPMPGHQMATGNIAEGDADELVLALIGRTYYYSYLNKGWTILTFAPMKTIIAGRFTGGQKDDLITCMSLNNNIFLRPSASGAWQLLVTGGNSNAMTALQ